MRGATAHEPTTRDCVLRYYEYRRVLAAAEHARAFECFELATTREPENAEAWAGLSLLSTDAWAHDFAGQAGSAATLERARETARRAMDIDGENLHANLALAGILYFSGDDFRDVAERILAAWPENAEAQAYVGALFILSGETDRGSALVANAIEWTPEVPSGYFASSALVALREHRYDDALASALRIDSPDWPLGHLILAAAAALGGRLDLAVRARERLVELDPTIAKTATRPAAPLARRAGSRRRDRARVRRGGAGAVARSLQLAVRGRQMVDQALKLEREVVELGCGQACDLRELDELLEALEVVDGGDGSQHPGSDVQCQQGPERPIA